jgi:adhesin HecA-like repeat protein
VENKNFSGFQGNMATADSGAINVNAGEVDVGAGSELIAGGGMKITAAKLDVYGSLGSRGDMFLTAEDIFFTGGAGGEGNARAEGNLTIGADRLLRNLGGVLRANGDISIDDPSGNDLVVENITSSAFRAVIEALGGSVYITADRVENGWEEALPTVVQDVETKTGGSYNYIGGVFEYFGDDSGARKVFGGCGAFGDYDDVDQAGTRCTTSITFTTPRLDGSVDLAMRPSILANRDITVGAEFINDVGLVSAGGDTTIDGALNNHALTGVRKVEAEETEYQHDDPDVTESGWCDESAGTSRDGHKVECHSWKQRSILNVWWYAKDIFVTNHLEESETVILAAADIEEGANPDFSGGVVDVDASGPVGVNTASPFSIDDAPLETSAAGYTVETDPALSAVQIRGAEYLLDEMLRVGADPDTERMLRALKSGNLDFLGSGAPGGGAPTPPPSAPQPDPPVLASLIQPQIPAGEDPSPAEDVQLAPGQVMTAGQVATLEQEVVWPVETGPEIGDGPAGGEIPSASVESGDDGAPAMTFLESGDGFAESGENSASVGSDADPVSDLQSSSDTPEIAEESDTPEARGGSDPTGATEPVETPPETENQVAEAEGEKSSGADSILAGEPKAESSGSGENSESAGSDDDPLSDLQFTSDTPEVAAESEAPEAEEGSDSPEVAESGETTVETENQVSETEGENSSGSTGNNESANAGSDSSSVASAESGDGGGQAGGGDSNGPSAGSKADDGYKAELNYLAGLFSGDGAEGGIVIAAVAGDAGTEPPSGGFRGRRGRVGVSAGVGGESPSGTLAPDQPQTGRDSLRLGDISISSGELERGGAGHRHEPTPSGNIYQQ